MWIAISIVVVVSFLLYVCMFGGSSTGVIGTLHHFLTAGVGGCVRRVLGKCFGKRCFSCMEKVEDYCCWRPNPLLQLFYLGLMSGGFALYWMHSLPQMPNPRLPPATILLRSRLALDWVAWVRCLEPAAKGVSLVARRRTSR